MKSQSDSRGKAGKSKRHSGRLLAEWVSLAVSSLIILGLAGFLVFEALHQQEPFVPVEVQARTDEARQINSQFILPVHILNRGDRTLRDLKIEVRVSSASGGESEHADFLIDFLGEGSEQVAYFTVKDDPRKRNLQARVISYRTE